MRLETGETMVLARYSGVADRVGALTRSAFGWALSLLLDSRTDRRLSAEPRTAAPRARDRHGDAAGDARRTAHASSGVRTPRRIRSRRQHRQPHARSDRAAARRSERRVRQHRARSAHAAYALARATASRTADDRRRRSARRSDRTLHRRRRCVARSFPRVAAHLRTRRHAPARSIRPVSISNETLERVHELYAPLAEEKSLRFSVEAKTRRPCTPMPRCCSRRSATSSTTRSSFRPQESAVTVRALANEDGPRGSKWPTAAPACRPPNAKRCCAVFIAASRWRNAGFGLGLPLVAAIARLHGFCFEIGDRAGGGARMTLYCWPCESAGARSA